MKSCNKISNSTDNHQPSLGINSVYAIENDKDNDGSAMDFYDGKYPLGPYNPKIDDFSLVYINSTVNLGVITRRAFEPEQIVAQIHGEIVSDIRQHTLQLGPGTHIYDPYFSGYISHSCDPNIRLETETCQLIAIKAISPYQRLSMDYTDSEDILFKSFPCSCGSTQCRGWIQGKKESNQR